jgi:phosphate transport system permease protein
MGMSVASPIREAAPRSGTFIASGLAAWLCGVFAIGLAGAMIVLLARAGWQEIARETVSGSDVIPSLEWSLALIAIALPLAAIVSMGAGVAAAEPEIGGRAGRFLNVALRAGPAVPSVAIGVAAFALIAMNPYLLNASRLHPIVSAAVALAALNLPIMSARFRTAFRSVALEWRVAAAACGATPGLALRRIVLPRAWPGILAALLNGAGQMLGETAVIAIVLRVSNGAPTPISVFVWQHLTSRAAGATGPIGSAEALVLVAAVAALRLTSRALPRRRRRSGAPA